MFISFNNFNENIINLPYLFEIKEKDFNNIINKYCKNFDPNDKPILRGYKKLNNNFYFINSKKNKNQSTVQFDLFHLYFMDKWSTLPKKSQSFNFVINSDLVKYYGNVYQFIPFDNAKYIIVGNTLNKMAGLYNKVLDNDLNLSVYNMNIYLNRILLEFKKDYLNMEEKIKFLNKLFKDKSPIIYKHNMGRMLQLINERNTSFINYLTYIFSSNSYIIKNYNELEYNDIGWTDIPGVLINFEFSKQYFKLKK
jgi:hypothetical protein